MLGKFDRSARHSSENHHRCLEQTDYSGYIWKRSTSQFSKSPLILKTFFFISPLDVCYKSQVTCYNIKLQQQQSILV